jgi:hypothetical protein
MATKVYLRSGASGFTLTGNTFDERIASLSAGPSLATLTQATITTGGNQPFITGASDQVRHIIQVNAVTISGTITANVWMSESNMSANVGATCSVDRYSSAGSFISGVASAAKSIELPVTTRAAQNWTITPTSRTFSDGDLLVIQIQGAAVGTMASGFTFDLGYDGATGAADGDSWVQFTETITEFTAAAQVVKTDPISPLLAQ